MRPIELALERTVAASADDVFARLVDIEGYNDWLPGHGSMLKATHLTSAGPPTVGTTYVDETKQGDMPGEILEMEAPRWVLFHWWETSRKGKVTFEGWPGFELEPLAADSTLVRHTARLQVNGVWQLGRPLFRLLARRERTATLEALGASFDGR